MKLVREQGSKILGTQIPPHNDDHGFLELRGIQDFLWFIQLLAIKRT